MNLDEILKYRRPKETFYDILGCHQSSSADQINREYKVKALQLHPDKNPDPESLDKFRRLQAAKDVLSDETSRRSYDNWLNSRINIPFEQWHNRKGHSMHWATPRSMKLEIQGVTISGQGSEFKLNNETDEKSWLEKFRKYEI